MRYKSILVIGLGRFGSHLAKKLVELGNEVMVIDRDEEAVERLRRWLPRPVSATAGTPM
jgi:trk system potassium uptake protein TrkA